MKLPEKIELVSCDPEDIDNAMAVVLKSFAIEYDAAAWQNVKTFGEFCDVVVAAIVAALPQGNGGGCTGQQGFYKVRAAIVAVLGPRTITPATKMRELFPRRGRHRMALELQQELGVGMELLNLKRDVGWWLFGCYLIAFLGIFINWRYGVAGLGICMVINWAAWRLANEFMYETVWDVARSFTLCYYRRARRDPDTVNRDEIVPVIKGIFMRVLPVGPEVLGREAVFG